MDVNMDLKIKELDEFKTDVPTDMMQDSTSSRMNSACHEQKVPTMYVGELEESKENSMS